MPLTLQDVRKIAHLARLELGAGEHQFLETAAPARHAEIDAHAAASIDRDIELLPNPDPLSDFDCEIVGR